MRSSQPPFDVDRAQGLLLGLLLGDAQAFHANGPAEPLSGSAAGQLACFVTEGLLQAQRRSEGAPGLDDQRLMVWLALRRWAHGRGAPISAPVMHSGAWPDGWLAQLEPLRRPRGRANATWQALKAPYMGSATHPLTRSAGYHALTNTAPVALFPTADVGRGAAGIAALTHGAPAAVASAALGARLLQRALRSESVARAVGATTPPSGTYGTAQHALHQALVTAKRHPRREAFLLALSEADREGGRGACIFTGALLGAVHGAAALPQQRLAALELGPVGLALAAGAAGATMPF